MRFVNEFVASSRRSFSLFELFLFILILHEFLKISKVISLRRHLYICLRWLGQWLHLRWQWLDLQGTTLVSLMQVIQVGDVAIVVLEVYHKHRISTLDAK